MGLGGPGGVLKVLGVFWVSQGGVWGPGDGILGVRMCWKGGAPAVPTLTQQEGLGVVLGVLSFLGPPGWF